MNNINTAQTDNYVDINPQGEQMDYSGYLSNEVQRSTPKRKILLAISGIVGILALGSILWIGIRLATGQPIDPRQGKACGPNDAYGCSAEQIQTYFGTTGGGNYVVDNAQDLYNQGNLGGGTDKAAENLGGTITNNNYTTAAAAGVTGGGSTVSNPVPFQAPKPCPTGMNCATVMITCDTSNAYCGCQGNFDFNKCSIEVKAGRPVPVNEITSNNTNIVQIPCTTGAGKRCDGPEVVTLPSNLDPAFLLWIKNNDQLTSNPTFYQAVGAGNFQLLTAQYLKEVAGQTVAESLVGKGAINNIDDARKFINAGNTNLIEACTQTWCTDYNNLINKIQTDYIGDNSDFSTTKIASLRELVLADLKNIGTTFNADLAKVTATSDVRAMYEQIILAKTGNAVKWTPELEAFIKAIGGGGSLNNSQGVLTLGHNASGGVIFQNGLLYMTRAVANADGSVTVKTYAYNPNKLETNTTVKVDNYSSTKPKGDNAGGDVYTNPLNTSTKTVQLLGGQYVEVASSTYTIPTSGGSYQYDVLDANGNIVGTVTAYRQPGSTPTASNPTTPTATTPPSGSTTVYTYTCNSNYQCTQVTGNGGQYSSQAACNAACVKPDLTITKVSSKKDLSKGELANFTITITNSGQTNVNGKLVVDDTLPAGMSYVAASGNGFACTPTNQTFQCIYGTDTSVLTPGSSHSFVLTARVDNPVWNQRYTNTATVTGLGINGGISGELNTQNNSSNDYVQFLQGNADITVSKVAVAKTVQVNTTAKFNILVSNSGAGATSGIVNLTDTIPSGFTYQSYIGSGWSCGYDTATSKLNCTYGNASTVFDSNTTLPVLQIVGTIAAAGTYTNNVAVSLATGVESRTDNNTSSDTITAQVGVVTLAKECKTLSVTNPSGVTTVVKGNMVQITATTVDVDPSNIVIKFNEPQGNNTTVVKVIKPYSQSYTGNVLTSIFNYNLLNTGSYVINLFEENPVSTYTQLNPLTVGQSCVINLTGVDQDTTKSNVIIVKTANAVCSTDASTITVNYSVIVTNTGSACATLTSTEDSIDAKVMGTNISSISDNGIFSGSKITWGNVQLCQGQSKTYTYTVTKLIQDLKNAVPAGQTPWLSGWVVATISNPATNLTGAQVSFNSSVQANCSKVVVPTPPTPGLPATSSSNLVLSLMMLSGAIFTIALGLIVTGNLNISYDLRLNRKNRFEDKF